MAKEKKYTPVELMNMAIDESHKSKPEHTDKTDPLVGAIITTKEGKILAKAHRGELRVGEHCEYTLIERKLVNENLNGCILYVTLEPCTDDSRNINRTENEIRKKGCSSHIVKARLSEVYIGIEDPNPKIATEGKKCLEKNKITVHWFPPELGDIIRKDNEQFIKEKELEALQIKIEKPKEQLNILEESAQGTNLNSFSSSAIQKFIKESKAGLTYPSKEFNEWAHELGFLEKEEKTGKYKPTGLGIMLFGINPENKYPQTIFKAEIKYGKGQPEVRDFKGPLVEQLPEIINFIKYKGLKLTMDKSTGKREEVSDFPFEILLEAIANAIIHRDYTIGGATNYLYIDQEKIIVRSPGLPLFPLTIEDMKKFDAPSLNRNPKIMFIFNQMHVAEQRGIGLRSMKQLPEKGFPLPKFAIKAGMLEIIFGRTKEFLAKEAGYKNIDKLTKEEKDVLLFVQERGEISSGDYAKNQHIEPKKAQRLLNKLVNMNILTKEGTKRGTKFYLNDKKH